MGRLSLAMALMTEEKPAEAETVLRRLLARTPDDFDAHKMLGDILPATHSSRRQHGNISAPSIPDGAGQRVS